MLTAGQTVFLLDVDDTLLDNDRFTADLSTRLERDVGAAGRDRYWAIFSAQRAASGYADYLGALQAFRLERDGDPALPGLAEFLLEYPFADRLYPGALEVVAHLRTLGRAVVLSDGDIVYQPRKIARAGIGAAVAGAVLVYLHKDRMLAAMQRNYPASHYVFLDDKPLLLAAIKRALGDAATSVLVRQGHYAHAPEAASADPPPDRVLEAIGDALHRDTAWFRHGGSTAAPNLEHA